MSPRALRPVRGLPLEQSGAAAFTVVTFDNPAPQRARLEAPVNREEEAGGVWGLSGKNARPGVPDRNQAAEHTDPGLLEQRILSEVCHAGCESCRLSFCVPSGKPQNLSLPQFPYPEVGEVTPSVSL